MRLGPGPATLVRGGRGWWLALGLVVALAPSAQADLGGAEAALERGDAVAALRELRGEGSGAAALLRSQAYLAIGDHESAWSEVGKADQAAREAYPKRWARLGSELVEARAAPLRRERDLAGLEALISRATDLGWASDELRALEVRVALARSDPEAAAAALAPALEEDSQRAADDPLRRRNGLFALRLAKLLARQDPASAARWLEQATSRGARPDPALARSVEAGITRLRRALVASLEARWRDGGEGLDPLVKAALARFPGDPEVLAMVQRVQAGPADQEAARAATRQALEDALAGEDLSVLASVVTSAEALGMSGGDLDRARERLTQDDARREDLAEGRRLLRAGQYAEAARHLERVVDQVDDPELSLDLAEAYLGSEKPGAALRRLGESPPGSGRGLRLWAQARSQAPGGGLAQQLAAAGAWAEAGEPLQAALQLASAWPWPWLLGAVGALVLAGLAAGVGLRVGGQRGGLRARAAEREMVNAQAEMEAQERRAAQREGRATEKAVALSHLASQVGDLAGALDAEEMSRGLVAALTRSLAVSTIHVWRVDTARARLVPVEGVGTAGAEPEPMAGDSPFGYAWREARPLDRKEVLRDPKLARLRGKGSVPLGLAVPVAPANVPGLVLNLAGTDLESLPSTDRLVLRALTSVAELALQNCELFALSERERRTSAAEAQRARTLMRRVVSPRVAERMLELERTGAGAFDSRKMELTILFSDIRGFTTLSEGMDPVELVASLNDYLSEMTKIIFEHNGTIDKYWGDAIVAYFGAPVDLPDHASWAARCAQSMQRKMASMRGAWEASGRAGFEMGIGLNTGPVVWGAIGSEAQMSYTVIGDHVNVAARLQGAAAGGQVLISRSTWEAAGRPAGLEELEPLAVKGRDARVEVFDLPPGQLL